jgi:adenylate cyclase
MCNDDVGLSSSQHPLTELSEAWRENFERHNKGLRRFRRLLRRAPSDPRCKLCYVPFSGLGGRLLRPFRRYQPSRKNPRLCAQCFEQGPDGGFETEAGIVFADTRGFTSLSETLHPAEAAALLNRFYEAASKILIRHDGIVDIVGDQVMGIFWPLIVDGDPCVQMVSAGEEVLRALAFGTDEEPWLAVGVGIDFGRVYIGNVGGREVRDFTALGDAVNTAARLQGAAAPGQILMSERVYEGVAHLYPGAESIELELKGKSQPVAARLVDVHALRSVAA